MYMNISEVNTLLQNALFTDPVTESIQDYEFYRGRRKVSIFTVRYNLVPTFDLKFMQTDLVDKLLSHYPRGITLAVAVNYDLLLCSNPRDDDNSPPTYYIWRANSNQRSLDREDNNFDKTMYFRDENVDTLCANAVGIDVADQLNIEFVSSNVSIDRVLSIVLTFSSVT